MKQERNHGVFIPFDDNDVKGHLAVFVPGQGPTIYPEGMAKLLPANANLVFQIHYTPNGEAGTDQSSVAIKFTDEEPSQHVMTSAVIRLFIIIWPTGAAEFPAPRTQASR